MFVYFFAAAAAVVYIVFRRQRAELEARLQTCGRQWQHPQPASPFLIHLHLFLHRAAACRTAKRHGDFLRQRRGAAAHFSSSSQTPRLSFETDLSRCILGLRTQQIILQSVLSPPTVGIGDCINLAQSARAASTLQPRQELVSCWFKANTPSHGDLGFKPPFNSV